MWVASEVLWRVSLVSFPSWGQTVKAGLRFAVLLLVASGKLVRVEGEEVIVLRKTEKARRKEGL